MNLKNSNAFKNYVENAVPREVKIADAKVGEIKKLLEDVAFVKSNEDLIAKAMVHQWMKKRVLEHLVEKEEAPFFERVKAAQENDLDWIKRALEKGEAVYFFNEAKVPEQFKNDLEYIGKYLASVAKKHLRKALNDDKSITLDMLKHLPEYDTFASVLYMANDHKGLEARAEEKRKIRAEKKQSLEQDTKLVMDLGDGFKAVLLMTEEALDKESEYMGHCVGKGDYDRYIKTGKASIYSIRDKDGNPHATLEVKNNEISECTGKFNNRIVDKYIPYVKKFVLTQGIIPGYYDKGLGLCTDIHGNVYDINHIPAETVLKDLDFSRMEITEFPDLSSCVVKRNFICFGCKFLISLKGCPKEVEKIICSNCPSLISLEGCPKDVKEIDCFGCGNLKYIPDYIPDEVIKGLPKERIAECKANWRAKNKEEATRNALGKVISLSGNTR